MKVEQHVAMPDLFFRHFVVHFGSVGIRGAQRVAEGAIDAVILVFVGNGECENFLLVQVGETFHRSLFPRDPAPPGSWVSAGKNSILELF